MVKKGIPPFYVEPSNLHVQRAKNVIAGILRKEPMIKSWVFATDSGCFSEAGTSTLGFGPGDERFAHSDKDHVRIDDVITAAMVYVQLPIEYSSDLLSI